jgi:hypothetical protein
MDEMTFAEFESLLLLADRMILGNNPRQAAYGRGYQNGIKTYFGNADAESHPDHYYLAEIARREGHRDVHAYIRGYHDGCKGLKAEYIG